MGAFGQIWRFERAQSGATAVEFGLIGPLFLGLCLTIFDLGGMVLQSTLLDRALDKAVRVVRVNGGVTTISQTQFRDSVCGGMLMYSSGCASHLTVEMTVIKTTSNFPATSATCVSKTAPAPTVGYATGARSDMIFVRTCLSVAPLMPLVGNGLGLPRNASGRFDLVASSGFMNEP